MRITLDALNLSMSELQYRANRELETVKGGTLVVRNVKDAASAERVARLAMKKGWDVGCSKKGNYFLLILSKNMRNSSGPLPPIGEQS